MSIPRTSSQLITVRRLEGKIALEEAVNSPYFNAAATHPPTQLIKDFDGMPASHDVGADIFQRLDDIDKRLESMDVSGIQYAIVSLTSPGIEGVLDPDKAVDLARKTNDAIYETYVKAHPRRFGFFACVPMQKPELAAAELERAVTKLGAKGVLINGFSNLSKDDLDHVQYLDEPACEPFWAMLEKLQVPLYLHPRSPPPGQQRLFHGYPSIAQAGLAFATETAGHAVRIMCSGVLDRYPNVKIILGHLAEGLPFFIHRMQERTKLATKGTNGPYQKTLIEYFQTRFYATLAGVKRASTLQAAIAEMGESRVLYSVDYPYESNEEQADWFDGLPLNENTRRQLASENAKKLFNLNV
jgi:predicted TIM-barrel fold metal-dependent hydrolase